jgi:hypothetical protein
MNLITTKQKTLEHVKAVLPRKNLSDSDLQLIEMMYDIGLLKGVNDGE